VTLANIPKSDIVVGGRKWGGLSLSILTVEVMKMRIALSGGGGDT
jgi:hypothetical protein